MIDLLLNHPGLWLIVAGTLGFALPRPLTAASALLLPIAGIVWLVQTGHMVAPDLMLGDLRLTPQRIDHLSFIFSLIFLIAALLGGLYAIAEGQRSTLAAGQIYAGSAIGAVMAGDLLSLFIYWEITALSSVVLILNTRSPLYGDPLRASLRYFAVQIVSGVLLLAGAVQIQRVTGSLAFNHIGIDGPGGLLILLAFGIKCAFPLLHNWLQDAYPRSSASGTVMLSAFTTKLAVYALARGYAGTEMLIWIGATMTVFPIFFAVLENDLRKVLAYSLNNQLGFMVTGIGIGTTLALDGAAAHAFAHILYKALLFMSMGAVLFRVGTTRATELGGLARSMPITTTCCIIGSASISAVPLLSGFVTKSMILSAAAHEGYWITWLVLLFASAGVLDHSGIKVPFFAFFAHDSGKRCKEAPAPMLAAMIGAAALCIGIGLYPSALYAILPFGSDYHPYTPDHVIGQLQLLLFAGLAFVVLFRTGLYPPEVRGLNIDSDWLYRAGLPALGRWVAGLDDRLGSATRRLLGRAEARLKHADWPAALVYNRWSVGVSTGLLLWLLVAFILRSTA